MVSRIAQCFGKGDRMSGLNGQAAAASGEPRAAWGAVAAMTLGVFGLVTAEFLPAGLLTPMAADLAVTEGQAGQAVTATAVVALATGIFVSTATRRIDRRHLLIAFSVLLVASNLMVALTPDLPVLLAGRVMLGIAIGGFWTMATATAIRLVPAALVPRALSIIFTGVSAATVVAAPVGSFLGDVLGWRAVFLIGAGLGVLAFAAQLATLPRMAPSGATRLRTLVEVLARPGIGAGMLAVILVFAGHFALFTYIRPFLETVTGVAAGGVAAILLGFGLANFVGTFLAGFLIERSLRLTLVLMPLVMGVIGLALVGLGGRPVVDGALVAVWGLAFGAVPVAWTSWLARTVADEAESAGGLLVAAIQFAIAAGAAVGGGVYDAAGADGVFTVGGAVLVVSALMVLAGIRRSVPAGRLAAARDAL